MTEGGTFEDVEKLDRLDQNWMAENDAQPIVIRQTPLIFSERSGTPFFLDCHVGTHEVAGKARGLWMNTPNGQKLNEAWQSMTDFWGVTSRLYREFFCTVCGD